MCPDTSTSKYYLAHTERGVNVKITILVGQLMKIQEDYRII